MHVICVGLSHKTAPVAVRETLAVPACDLPAALARLAARPSLREAIILSTCNRLEVYAVSADPAAARADLLAYLTADGQAGSEAIAPHLYWRAHDAAVRHLFSVAAGLDAMILGETQILGQVKAAYRGGMAAGTVGKVLHQVCTQALTVGKRAHTETGISQNAVSVGYAAVELARKVFGNLQGRKVLVIGAGKMAELALCHLKDHGVTEVTVANRTRARARAVAERCDGQAAAMAEIAAHLPAVDVVISSTAAPHLVLSRGRVQEAMRQRRGRPLLLVDIAVPRDIDPAVGRLEGVFLYDIDDLQSVVAHNLAERAYEARKVEKIIDEELARFGAWRSTLEIVPAIKLLRAKVEDIRRQELQRALGKLPELTERQRSVIEAMTVTMINKILNDPTQRLRGLAEAEDPDRLLDTVAELFDLPVGKQATLGLDLKVRPG